MSTLVERFSTVKAGIERACVDAQRNPSEVSLIAVSKTFPATHIHALFEATKQAHFGENYVQEALEKIAQLDHYREHLIWHFIGPLQSNKTRQVAEAFDWVHSVDRFKIAQRLSEQRPGNMSDLNVLVQLNISNEPTKSGVSEEELVDLIPAIKALPRLCLQGLMAIPAPGDEERAFARMQELAQQHALPHLSMGMSGDYGSAIAAGATFVRIGTAIFGKR